MYRVYYFIFVCLVFSKEENFKYVDLEGNEIIFKNKKWNYIMIPDNECSIPFNEFANYIAENSDIEFLNKKEAYRFGVYKMPHMNICPPIDYAPYIYPINAEYQIKSNWDSLKVGMKQKKVREIMKFDPMITYKKNNIKYWEYNKFGTLEFDKKGILLKWEFLGRDNQTIYRTDNKENHIKEKSNNNILFKVKNKIIEIYSFLKSKALELF